MALTKLAILLKDGKADKISTGKTSSLKKKHTECVGKNAQNRAKMSQNSKKLIIKSKNLLKTA